MILQRRCAAGDPQMLEMVREEIAELTQQVDSQGEALKVWRDWTLAS